MRSLFMSLFSLCFDKGNNKNLRIENAKVISFELGKLCLGVYLVYIVLVIFARGFLTPILQELSYIADHSFFKIFHTAHVGANRLAHPLKYILTLPVMCSQQLCLLC